MTQEGAPGQGFHAALIQRTPLPDALKHFRRVRLEMLQEISAACVDLGRDRP